MALPPTKHDPRFITEMFNPLPDDKILDWSKLKQVSDNNFKFDEK